MTKEDIVQMYQQGEITPACRWKLEGARIKRHIGSFCEHEWEPISTFNFSTGTEHMDNPFGASSGEQYWSGKYFETPPEEEFVLKSDFSSWKIAVPVVCVAIGLLVVWPRATDLTNATQELAAKNPTSAASTYGLSNKHTSHRNASDRLNFQQPAYQPGLKRVYYCGNGYGHVKITSLGTVFPPIQQKYFADKGIFLINEVKRITGYAPPEGFYFDITFFKNPADYIDYCRRNGKNEGAAAFCIAEKGKLISPIFAKELGDSETADVIAHEMIHAIAIASFGDFPQCFDEGIADWLGYSYRHRIANVSNFYHQADARYLANGIRTGTFPSLNTFLACGSYEDWDRLFDGERRLGYQIGGMFLDHLWTHHRKFLLNGLAYCRQFHSNSWDDRPIRSRAFRNFVGNNWPGGWADLDRRFQNWILDRAKFNWQPDE